MGKAYILYTRRDSTTSVSGIISAAAFTLWSILLKYNDVGRVSIYKFTIPLFGTLLSYLILKERFLGFNVALAAILVSLGILLINMKSGTAILSKTKKQ